MTTPQCALLNFADDTMESMACRSSARVPAGAAERRPVPDDAQPASARAPNVNATPRTRRDGTRDHEHRGASSDDVGIMPRSRERWTRYDRSLEALMMR